MKHRFLLWVLLLPFFAGCTAEQPQTDKVRNVIYMIGDGMGLSHVSMLQLENNFEPTSFDRADAIALQTTRSLNNRVTDSAAAGTALASGEKTDNSVLGQKPDGTPCISMMTKAAADGMQTGIVVTCTLQHATPGAFYAHQKYRRMPEEITADMLACDFDVLVGGGRRWLIDTCSEGGSYLDAFARKGYRVVSDMEQLAAIDSDRVLAVMAEEHLPHAAERGNYLPGAVGKTLDILAKRSSDRGFMLMVEGSQIDKAAHKNELQWLIDEMRDFDRAVKVAMDFADRTPGTLVVITADHETGGLSILSRENDFMKEESGIEHHFATHGHSGSMVPVYLYGAGADRISGVMDNTDLAKRIMALVGLD